MTEYLIDCMECGGGGCARCNDAGTECAVGYVPAIETIRADNQGFDDDRQSCPCYQGIKFNEGVDQCIHPGNPSGDNWCEPRSCPLLKEVRHG